MAVTQSSEAGRAVASNLHAKRMADAKAKRADVTTPIPAPPDAEALFEDDAPAPAKPAPQIILSITIPYRGRVITISGQGLNLDSFCDMLDKRLGVPS